MLQSLQIRNLALLEEVALDFEGGFTVVTGENLTRPFAVSTANQRFVSKDALCLNINDWLKGHRDV